MDEHHDSQSPARPRSQQAAFGTADVDLLLRQARRAIEGGNVAGARALLRVLLRQEPGQQRAWRLLAEVAETPAEEQHALEQASLLGGPALAQPKPRSRRPWGLLLALALVGGVLAGLLLWSFRDPAPQVGQSAAAPPSDAAAQPPEAPPEQTALPTTPPTATPTVTPTPTPTPLPRPEVQALGTLLSYDGWNATLLRPDHAQILTNSLGEVQARGRFALALLAVSNTTTSTRRLSPDMFALVDAQGQRYRPVAGASSAYLDTYGRGMHGDLAFEDEIPPTSGMFSVPLLFDVDPNVSELILTMGQDGTQGWPVLTPTPTPVPPDATPAPPPSNAGP
jgi:hypothetical protein